MPVEGELWEVDDACLALLDAVDSGLLERKLVRLVGQEGVEAYFYSESVNGMEDFGC